MTIKSIDLIEPTLRGSTVGYPTYM